MTPQKLDWRSLCAKLRQIRALLDDLSELGHLDVTRLRTDRLAAAWPHWRQNGSLPSLSTLHFAINSHVAVSVLQRAPDTYAESALLAAEAKMIGSELAEVLLPSAGMRNVLVHNYLEVDYQRVAAAIPLAIEQYGEYVRRVARWSQERWSRPGGAERTRPSVLCANAGLSIRTSTPYSACRGSRITPINLVPPAGFDAELSVCCCGLPLRGPRHRRGPLHRRRWVVTCLERWAAERGAPIYVRFDHGPEFIAQAVADWCRFRGTGTVFIGVHGQQLQLA